MTPRHLLIPLWLALPAFFVWADAAVAHHGPSHAETEVDEFEEHAPDTLAQAATLLAWGVVGVALIALSRTAAPEPALAG